MTQQQLALSVLDLVPVRTGQDSAHAVASSLALVEAAERLGYQRFWYAEHHNMLSVGSTTPPVLIAAAAARTERIRLGSGGVMLPNHAPLVVAEQFAALEALAPGRIDLGLGRAPGSDPVITALLRSSGGGSDVEQFPRYVEDIALLASAEGAELSLTSGRSYTVRATPNARSVPTVWLLGSSDYSARLAAKLGLPYVFAHHFSGEGTEQALAIYRGEFTPGAIDAPRTFLTVNTVVADTDAEARALALPQLLQMARLRSGEPMTTMPTVEEAAAIELKPHHESLIASMRERWVIGEADAAAEQLRALATRFGVDEVMLSPVAGSREAEPLDGAGSRERTLELVAGALRVSG